MQTYDTMISGGEAAVSGPTSCSATSRSWRAGSGTMPPPSRTRSKGRTSPDARQVKAAVGVPVICTGGFQTALGHRRRHQARRLRLVSASPAADRQQRPGRTSSRAGRTARTSPAPTATNVWRTSIEHPLGCYEESRFPIREAMLAQVMTVFDPPPFRRLQRRPRGVADRTRMRMPWPSGGRSELASAAGRACQMRSNARSAGCSRIASGTAAAPARDGPAGRDPQRAAREEPARHRGAAAREAGRSRADLDPALREARIDRRHATTICSIRRWDRSAAASAATCRSSTRVPDTAEPADPEPAHRQPRADDPRSVPAGDVPQSAGGVLDPVHGARLVRAQALDDRALDIPTGAGRRLGRAEHPRAARRCRSRRRPGRRGRRPTPT